MPKKKDKKKYKFKIDQTVRISHVRSMFDREYSQKWTGEIFKAGTGFRRDDVPIYTLEIGTKSVWRGHFTNRSYSR